MNRKSLIPDRSLSVPMTLSDLERQDTRNPAYQSIFIYARSYRLTDGDKIGHGLGEGRIYKRSGKPSDPRGGPSAPPLLVPLTWNDQICRCYTDGEGRVSGSATPLHLQKNASRGLSAIAEFLVTYRFACSLCVFFKNVFTFLVCGRPSPLLCANVVKGRRFLLFNQTSSSSLLLTPSSASTLLVGRQEGHPT